MLVRDIDTIRTIEPVNQNIDFDTLFPFLEQAEYKYIINPVLGKEQYDALDAAITDDDLTAAQTALLAMVRKAIVFYALYEAVPRIQVMVSDMGVVEPTAERIAQAPQWKTSELRASYWSNAQTYRQATQELLQDNQADYPLWVDSRAYTVFNGLFIRTSRELADVIGMSEDIASFVAMRPAIERSEESYLRGVLSQPFMVYLKELMAINDLSEEEAIVVGYARKALGHYALYESVPTITFAMREGVLQVVSNAAAAMKLYQPLSDTQRVELRQKAERDGRFYLTTLKEYVEDNADDFPTYKSSTAYIGAQPYQPLPVQAGHNSFML